MKIAPQTQAIAARLAHELANPMGAAGHALEVMSPKINSLLSPLQQKFYQAGQLASFAPATATYKAPDNSSKKLPAPLALRLQQATLKNKSVARLASGLTPKALAGALNAFELGFTHKCAMAGLHSSNEIIKNLRSFGDFARSDLLQETRLEDTLHIAWTLVSARQKHLYGAWRIAPLPALRANPQSLVQVWVNIFANAAQINPTSCGIEISAYKEKEKVRDNVKEKDKNNKKTGQKIIIHIANTGKPLPQGIDIFAEGASTRTGGRGLGLHLCREIVTAHGGRIWATTGAGNQGAVFSIELPAHDTKPALKKDKNRQDKKINKIIK